MYVWLSDQFSIAMLTTSSNYQWIVFGTNNYRAIPLDDSFWTRCISIVALHIFAFTCTTFCKYHCHLHRDLPWSPTQCLHHTSSGQDHACYHIVISIIIVSIIIYPRLSSLIIMFSYHHEEIAFAPNLVRYLTQLGINLWIQHFFEAPTIWFNRWYTFRTTHPPLLPSQDLQKNGVKVWWQGWTWQGQSPAEVEWEISTATCCVSRHAAAIRKTWVVVRFVVGMIYENYGLTITNHH